MAEKRLPRRILPIWVTTFAVILMILVLSLLVNDAREKEIVQQFSRQQLAIAKGTAAGIEDLFAVIERSIVIHSRYSGILGTQGMRLIYEDLEGRVEFIARGSPSGRDLVAYPARFAKSLSANSDVAAFMREVGKSGKTYIHDFTINPSAANASRLVALAAPQFNADGTVGNVVLAGLSLSGIVNRYVEPARHSFTCIAWIIDEDGSILSHPRAQRIGKGAEILEASASALKEAMLRSGEGWGEYRLRAEDNAAARNIVTFVPINLGVRKWSIAIATPYSAATSHLKKTYFILILETSFLILAVVIGSAIMVYSGRRRVRLEEEVKHLREKEKWREDLAREKKTIEGIIEGSPIPTFVIDRNHRIILWNRACTELTGYEAKDMIGTDRQYLPFYSEKRPVIADLIVERDTEGLQKYYGKQRVQPSAVVRGAYEASDFYENLGGKRRHLYFLASPIHDENGRVIAAIETLQDVTREREMERDLTEYAESIRSELNKNITLKKTIGGIIEGSPIPTFVIDKDHRIILWNRACTELTGYKATDMIGADRQYLPFYREKRPVIADIIVDGDIGKLEQYYGKQRVRPSAVVEGAYEARDFYEDLGGKRRHLYFLAAPIHDENGRIIAAIETLQDVTREREMERELKDNAESLRNELTRNLTLTRTIEGIIEGSPIPTFVIGSDHRILMWNKACAELTGYKATDMIGTDRQYLPFYSEKRPVIADLIVERDTEGLQKYYGKQRVQPSAVVRGAYEASDFYENLGGRRRHLYFLASPIHDENGRVIAAIETLQDVTREREMERNLKEYAESLKDELYENIKLRKDIEEIYNYLQSILDSSPDRIFALNSEGVINYVSRELGDGRALREVKGLHFTDFVDLGQREELLKRWEGIRRGDYSPFEVRAVARDGTQRDLLVTPRPIKGTDRYILVQRDITEFKNLERKFYESQKLAAVGQLSAGIAHEVRNPLSSIKMSLNILERRLNPAGNDLKRFKIAEKEVEHLEKLVSDILNYARPAEPELKPANVNAFLEHSLNMAEKELRDKKIEVKLALADELPPVQFDSGMMNQAFLNIYLNAIDAMPARGKLAIRSESADRGKAVRIEIEDTGAGIDREDLEHVFNPFFTRKQYGTGLGLTQVKKIIDLHRGAIDISSEKGKGTRVVVRLPAAANGDWKKAE